MEGVCLFELRKVLRELGANVALTSARKVKQTGRVLVVILMHARRRLETLAHTGEDLPKRDSIVEFRSTSPHPQDVPALQAHDQLSCSLASGLICESPAFRERSFGELSLLGQVWSSVVFVRLAS